MIRHSSSLLLSFIIHSILLVLAFYLYKLIFSQKKEVFPEHRVCVELGYLEKQVSKPKPLEKKPEPKKQEPPKQKPILKPKKVEKKVFNKELLIVKEEVKKIIIPKEIQKPLMKEETQVVLVEKEIEVETTAEQNVRLEKEYIDENVLKIRELISDNLYYPRSARKRGIIGEVMVKFTLLKNSEVYEASIISSHSEILSRAAIKTIINLSGSFPRPKTKLTLHVPISYTLQ